MALILSKSSANFKSLSKKLTDYSLCFHQIVCKFSVDDTIFKISCQIFQFYHCIERVGCKIRESRGEYNDPDETRSPKETSRNENCQYINLSWGVKFLLASLQVNKNLTSLIIFLLSMPAENIHILAELHLILFTVYCLETYVQFCRVRTWD